MHGIIGNASVRVHRVIRRSNDWTLKEHEVVVSYWPDIDEIAKRLPHRSRYAIGYFAGKCNLRKQIHSWTGEQHRILRNRVREGIPRAEIAKELGLTTGQIANRMGSTGLTYPRRRPKIMGNSLMDSIRQRAFDLNISMKELDEACKSGNQFAKYAACRHVHIKHIVKAAKVLDGEVALRWRDQ